MPILTRRSADNTPTAHVAMCHPLSPPQRRALHPSPSLPPAGALTLNPRWRPLPALPLLLHRRRVVMKVRYGAPATPQPPPACLPPATTGWHEATEAAPARAPATKRPCTPDVPPGDACWGAEPWRSPACVRTAGTGGDAQAHGATSLELPGAASTRAVAQQHEQRAHSAAPAAGDAVAAGGAPWPTAEAAEQELQVRGAGCRPCVVGLPPFVACKAICII